MKTPDYKRRAAKAAENWIRLQAQKNLEEDTFVAPEIYDQGIEQTMAELIDNLEMPKTSVKGIHIVKNQEAKEELRDIA